MREVTWGRGQVETLEGGGDKSGKHTQVDPKHAYTGSVIHLTEKTGDIFAFYFNYQVEIEIISW